MTRLIRVGVIGALFVAAGAAAAYVRRPAPPPAAAYPDALDLGEQPFGAVAVGRFRVSNDGGSELVVGEFTTSCSCAGVEAESDGESKRVGSLRLAPGQTADLTVRVAVGAKVGTPQLVHVGFTTNDPRRPSGGIVVTVPRVRGGVHAEPQVAVFGEVAAGASPTRTLRLFDNNLPGVVVTGVRSLDPTRFTAVLVAPVAGEAPASHESAGRQVATVLITARADAGPITGQLEIRLAGEGRTPDRLEVLGEVVGHVTCRPDRLVLPRYVGGVPVFEGSVRLSGRGGQSVRVESATAPAGVTATHQPAEGGEVVVTVRAAVGAAGGPVRLRVKLEDGGECSVEIPVSLTTGE